MKDFLFILVTLIYESQVGIFTSFIILSNCFN